MLVTGIGGDEGALGYFGLADVVENEGKVKTVAVDNAGDGTCVLPSVDTVKNGTYQPLSRPLFIYVTKSAADRPEVRGFVSFYLSKSFTPIIQSREVGYIALPDNVYEAVRARFAGGITGTLFPRGSEVGATLDRYLQP